MTRKHNREQDKLMQEDGKSKASARAVPVSNFAEGRRRCRSVLLLRHRQALQQFFQNNRTHLLITPIPKPALAITILIEKSMPIGNALVLPYRIHSLQQ
jgi:hypothetical protein